MQTVFGPNRPLAALRAIQAEQQAATALAELHPFDARYSARLQVLRTAQAVRAQYPEYGDSFRGH